MVNVVSIQKQAIVELYRVLNQLDLGFVKNCIFQTYKLDNCPSPQHWRSEIEALGVYYLFYKLAKKLNRSDFVSVIDGDEIDCLRYFTQEEQGLLARPQVLAQQGEKMLELLDSVAEIFEYEVWLTEHGMQVAYRGG